MAEEQPPKNWNESQVSTWLRSIGVKEPYIKKLYDEEVDGQILLALTVDFLKERFGMKLGPAHLIIQKRDGLINSKQQHQQKNKASSGKKTELDKKGTNEESVTFSVKTSEGLPTKNVLTDQNTQKETKNTLEQSVLTSKEDCRPRPFDQEAADFIYVKHGVMQPESGAFDLISPCHEYKSFTVAADLDRTRLQAKFAKEVLKFAIGCMNIRSNGTIHFGVVDSKENTEYVHGEIIGVPVKDKDIYVDALDYVERSVSSDAEHVRQCVRPPRFIEVMDKHGAEKSFVVEVDIVPLISIVKNKVYAVRLPNFKESTNKVELEKQAILRRVGSKTEPVNEQVLGDFYHRVQDRDAQREEAEKKQFLFSPGNCQDLGRKLKMFMTSGKKLIEKGKWFILVTNKFKPEDLDSLNWLLNMNLFCVFDFDPDSKVSGLCSRYLECHAANMHFPQDYRMCGDKTVQEFTIHMHLFEQTSWIFCNGRNDFKGDESPCDEMTWIKTKMTFLRECVSLICKQILPKGTFQVIFLLTSPVEKPLLHTFNEFFTDMNGHEDIICICESEKYFEKWQSFAEGSCGTEVLNNFSVVGMKMSHIDATLQQIQHVTTLNSKYLPVYVKGTCLLQTHLEEQMYSLEILTVNHCNETSKDFISEEKANIEQKFYHGGKVNWLNFWLADHGHVGEVIKRDAYDELSKLLNSALRSSVVHSPVDRITIYHHPGSGGSTVARQLLWNNRRELRCAVVKASYSVGDVARHAVELREYEEKDPQRCLPVLLLIEDQGQEYLDELRNELEVAINTKQIQNGTLCFILLSCRRSHDPERKCQESLLQNVSITHKLSPQEKKKFFEKREDLEQQYEPDFILTFVLMSEEFDVKYIQEFVTNLLQDIDRQSASTRLIQYVALLNTYVPNSFISQSHCEAFLTFTVHLERFRQREFEKALGPQAKLVLLHLRDEKTHINSIRIIHPLVAKEILLQLLGKENTQSSLAMDFLREDVLFEHRFGRDEFLLHLRTLFIKRSQISKGDKRKTLFSPLIEQVLKDTYLPDTAIDLLKEAFQRFHHDAFVAQQLARLYYTYERFEEAKIWAETAARKQPNNSYILDTKGQVYRKWFQAKCKALDSQSVPKTAHNMADAVGTALKALECFHECEKAAAADREDANNSGYFSEVEVGMGLLKLISSMDAFAEKTNGHAEFMKYLITDYIPKEVEEAWQPFHESLKILHQTMKNALEWISEDLSYFQTDIAADEEETHESIEEKIGQPLVWLARRSVEYGKYFSEVYANTLKKLEQSVPSSLTPFQKRMIIYHLGGGNITSILSKLTDQRDAIRFLETILSLYPSDLKRAKCSQRDIINYIFTQITLNCLSPQNKSLVPLKDLQALCHHFPSNKRNCLPNALFLLTLLFWPEDDDNDQEKERKYEIVQSAVEHLDRGYRGKKKDIPQRKRRIYTHFFLGTGIGLDKFVHKKKFESVTKGFSVLEKRMKWFRGEAWKKPQLAKMLKTVSGWTQDGDVYLECPEKKNFRILPLHVLSVPHGNENITFYLGFTFRGPVAYNIVVKT
ncbi:sterile alpha motif domain-containing protein 9-like [Nelusetta ayraudi]|uniref:sterile alpha motif domain-containing protein 9-like n=1 Tax=Nelusetta ayraudi TaxID=303726 RepID=UPI003F7093C5